MNGGIVAETIEAMRHAADNVEACAETAGINPQAPAQYRTVADDHFDTVVVAGYRSRDPVITLPAA